MKFNWHFIKALSLLIGLGGLFAFSTQKNETREISNIEVNFLGNEHLYITKQNVKNIITNNNTKLTKATINLHDIENTLTNHDMIENAEIALTINGKIKTNITQRQPIARVFTETSYYIDSKGLAMPLSKQHSARVPLITGHINKNKLNNVFKIAKKIYNDEFLKQQIVEINQNKKGLITLKNRVYNFVIELGNLNQLDKKINNLKVFIQKTNQTKTIHLYSKINLQFENQVVATKKTNQ